MKKILLLATAALLSTGAFAKKVKFSVDMTGQTIAANGLHVEGDFQAAAGYGSDHNASSTSLTREGTTDIWSVTVSIPAFKAYQYKYVNGNQFYDAEFVPAESRVNVLLNDYRWSYVDSLNSDTMKLPAIQYGLNAPAGLYALRFKVDLRNAQPSTAIGAHVAGGFQSSNPATTRLYSFADSVYEYIAYVTAGTYDYKYYSGNTAATAETVPSACATNGSRSVTVTGDMVLNTVCFSSCSACVTTAVHQVAAATSATLAPNPVQDYLSITFNDGASTHDVSLTDMTGRTVRRIQQVSTPELRIARETLPAGIYTLSISADGTVSNAKISLQ